jgi:hypothetical protein
MKKDSTKNSAPIAPTSAEPSNAAGAKPVVAKPLKGKLVKKTGNIKGGPGTDPYVQAKPSRKFVTATGGARYGIRVGIGAMQVAPEAGATQGNGRLFASSTNRTSPNFKAGSADLM